MCKKDENGLFDDEIRLTGRTALGVPLGSIILRKEDLETLVQWILQSKSLESTYFYVTEFGKKSYEVTDGINHNPHNVDVKLGEKK